MTGSSFRTAALTIEIAEGDIAAQTTDAIVNAANNAFWMGTGVAGAIKARGGKAIEDEAMAEGPVEPGQCVVTTAGRLAARFVIHAAVMGQDLQTSAALIDRATRAALAAAEARRLHSIAFPAFGTGVGGFPVSECARIMIEAVRGHAAGSLQAVRFVLFGQKAYDAFMNVAREILPSDPLGVGGHMGRALQELHHDDTQECRCSPRPPRALRIRSD